MPSEFTFDRTGDITNRLRNSARPASTWFGGMFGTPSALRVSDSTTMILVKLVPSTSSAGAMASTVISRMITTGWLGLLPILSSRTVTEPGLAGAAGVTGWTAGATGFVAVSAGSPGAAGTPATTPAGAAAVADDAETTGTAMTTAAS